MRNTGILLLLVGIYIVINSGSFRDLVFGKASLGFLNSKQSSNSTQFATETSADKTTAKKGMGYVS